MPLGTERTFAAPGDVLKAGAPSVEPPECLGDSINMPMADGPMQSE